MIRKVLALALVSLLASSLQAEETHESWLKYFEGDWTWTSTNGWSGERSLERINKDVPALLVRFKQDAPATMHGIGVFAWHPGAKTLVDSGYNSAGGHGESTYAKIEPKKIEGVHKSTTAEGKVRETKFTLERISDSKYVIDVLEGLVTDEGELPPFKIEFERK